MSCVWFGSGRNKLMQLLIWSRNIFGRTVRTLAITITTMTNTASTTNKASVITSVLVLQWLADMKQWLMYYSTAASYNCSPHLCTVIIADVLLWRWLSCHWWTRSCSSVSVSRHPKAVCCTVRQELAKLSWHVLLLHSWTPTSWRLLLCSFSENVIWNPAFPKVSKNCFNYNLHCSMLQFLAWKSCAL